ncbi:zinc ribbon domain-containing protein [Pseudonocardia adelaidensis]|uniref:Cas12f1-like TNB domain-containing protein n=1 Tax=Pseudonocardia adelaidensis TaxID=648754 RepID=A0ABP9N6Y4_9PSEU
MAYKAEWHGRDVIAIGRFYPGSKTCSAGGAIMTQLPPHVREPVCRCAAVHDRDVNAAQVVLAAGLAVAACGDGVRPPHS